MAAASTEENIDNPLNAVALPQTGAPAARATYMLPAGLEQLLSGMATPSAALTAAEQSPADLALLQSLTAKIEELVGAASANPPAQRPRPADAAAARVSSAVAIAPPMESTQTVRPLTARELADGQASQWFAIQLMLSDDKIDAAEVPSLDIFSEYRLYSVTASENGRLMYALRLGFFSTELAAQSVARYLAGHFSAPTIKRVSIAEHERFADDLITAGKDIGASGQHAIIELVGAPAARLDTRSAAAPARQAKLSPPPARWLWSRASKPHRGADR